MPGFSGLTKESTAEIQEGLGFMSVKVNLILPDQIDEIWPDAEPLIAKAVEYCRGETNIEHVRDSLVEGTTKLLAVSDEEGVLIAGIILSMIIYPEKKVCLVSFAGGTRMEDWADQTLPIAEKIAFEAGAGSLRISGRKGWLRKFAKYGYQEYSTVIEKQLEG